MKNTITKLLFISLIIQSWTGYALGPPSIQHLPNSYRPLHHNPGKCNILLVWPPVRKRPVRVISMHYLASALQDRNFLYDLAEKFHQQNPNDHFYNQLQHIPADDLPPFNVDILDLSLTDKSFDLKKFLKDKKYSIIGFSTLTEIYKRTISFIEQAHEASPSSLIMVGGWHASALPKKTLKETNAHLVVKGQGVETLCDYALRLYYSQETSPLKERISSISPAVKNIYYYDNDAQIQFSGFRQMLLGFDHYPFPNRSYDSVLFTKEYPEERSPMEPDFNKKHNIAYVHTSFGCPFNCPFCANKAVYGRYISRDLENVKREILELYEKGYRIIMFRDEIFTLNKKRTLALVEFLKELKEQAQSDGSDIFWGCTTRADLLDKEMIAKMKDSGLNQIAFGIETGDFDLAKKVKRSHIDKQKVIANIEESLAQGIKVLAYMQVGLPGQTFTSILKSARFLIDLKITCPSIFVTIPYPGTDYYSHDNSGPIHMLSDITDGSKKHTETDALTDKEIKLAKKCFDKIAEKNRTNFYKPGGATLEEILKKTWVNVILGDHDIICGTLRIAAIADLVIRSYKGEKEKTRQELIDELIHEGGNFFKIYDFLLHNKGNPFIPEQAFNFLGQSSYGKKLDTVLGKIQIHNGFEALKSLDYIEMHTFAMMLVAHDMEKPISHVVFENVEPALFNQTMREALEYAERIDVSKNKRQKALPESLVQTKISISVIGDTDTLIIKPRNENDHFPASEPKIVSTASREVNLSD